MNLRDPKLYLAVFAGLGALAYAAADLRKTSPGPIAAAHLAVVELHGGNACASCHGGWFSDQTKACLDCHEPIAGQLAAHSGLHGKADPTAIARCGSCHGEHHGESFALVNRASWAQLGVADHATFDHARIDLPFAGRHLQLPCVRCHTHADDVVLARDTRRYLGLSRECGSCHEDPHRGAMQVGCSSCHGQESFAIPASTGHERFLPLLGGHQDLACDRCHEKGTPRDLHVLGLTTERSPRQCADCHRSPHQDRIVAAAAAAAPAQPDGETLPKGIACGICHEPAHREFAAARATMTADRHAAVGMALAPPHDVVACKQCHRETGTFAERHPGRDAAKCAECHADPHGGQFADSPLAENGCRSCHERERFAPHAFTLDLHARTALPLEGAHEKAECSSCHADPKAGAPRRFAGTKSRCEDCHENAHGDAFAGRSDLAADPRGTCAPCHDAVEFAAAAKGFDHGRFTAMPLDGAHAQVQCAACHPQRPQKDHAGRSFGRVADDHGAFRGCVTCHDDAHGGRFDRDASRAVIDGRRDCARCHGTASFRALSHGFDHEFWTGFALAGGHASAACSDCHPADPLAPPGTVAAPRGTRCAQCHEEPHAGQFALGNAAGNTTDCRRCHRPAATFVDLVFRHDTDARFALGDAHKNVVCSACHRTETIGEREVVRYRPVPRECVDCHGQEQDPLRRQARQQQPTGGGR